jgi:AcrR family transcriptional regulator
VTTDAGRPVRVRLLAAAEDLFYAHGIAAVGVDAVVARAGVATASLYKNFGGKDGLIAAYLAARDERWRQHWEAHIAQETDPVERVLAVFTALETWDAGHGLPNGCAHLAAIQQLPADHPGTAVSRAHKRHVRHRLAELTADLGCADPAETAAGVLLIYEGVLASQATDAGGDAIRRGRELARAHLRSARVPADGGG